jgi:hypothetical protein
MQQLTVYAAEADGEGFSAAYVVSMTREGAVAYAMKEGWEETARKVEEGLNRKPPGRRPVSPRRAGGNSCQ